MPTRVSCVGGAKPPPRRSGGRHGLPVQIGPEDVRGSRSLFRFLNDKDRDILYLIFVSRKNQVAVSRIMRRTQPCIVYDIKRIKERVRFIAYLRDTFDILADFLELRAGSYGQDLVDVLVMMYYTTSYTLSGKVLGLPQIVVRSAFCRALERMRRLRHWEAYELFSVIERNKNKIKRLCRRAPPGA
jgi:hypothetical protein